MNHRKHKFTATVIALFALGLTQTALHASGLLISDGGFGGRLEIKEQDVRVTINNGIAVTEISQIFLNKENRIVEALYTFPVPDGASVSNFSMIINGKEMIGEVVEKQRARQIYESYKSTRRDPGLLEQVNFKTFEMRVFPIAANAEQHIKITYYQKLNFDHDWATYVYPLATSTKGVDETTTGKFAMTLDIKSEIPIRKVESPSHKDDFVVASHTAKYTRASLETTKGDLSRDVVIAFQTKRPQTGIDVVTSKQGEDGYFMLTLTAGQELEQQSTGMDYVFVLDVSGSMRNKGKLGLSTQAARAFAMSLGKEDRFELISFNNVPEMRFGDLKGVTAETKSDADTFLESLRAKGGTDLHPALSLAFRYKDPDRPLNVVLLSDGMTGRTEQRDLLAAAANAETGTRIFCIGVGNEINRPLLKQVAEEAGGLSAFISTGDDFARQADAFRRKLVHPVATELSISVDNVETYDVFPNELPNLYHGSPIRMYGRYKKSGPANVTVSGNVLGRPFEQELQIEFSDKNDDNPQIERMWAYVNVQELMDEVRSFGETPQLKEEIVGLCEGYSIVSQYASFIVLENDREYRRWKIDRRNATRVRRDRRARQKVSEQLQEMRDSALAQMAPKKRKPATEEKPQLANRADQSVAKNRKATPSVNRPVPTQPISTSRNRNRDLDFGPVGGGGAVDPFTLMIAAGAAGVAGATRRRKNAASESAKGSSRQ